MIQEVHELGFRFLVYFFPYLVEERDAYGSLEQDSYYTQGINRGYVLKDEEDRPYRSLIFN